MTKDSLGDRMRRQYEDRWRVMLPRRTYTVIRCDGKAFHSFTRQCQKPNDTRLADALDHAAVRLCEEAQGACFGYLQSDEISVLLTDFCLPTTEAWFDGTLQKICSIAASIVTAEFNARYAHAAGALAYFDARVFVIPDYVEVENYFVWRQQDATRNSIQGLAQSQFDQKRLHGLDYSALQELLFREKGINWNDTEPYWKRGRCVVYGERWQIDRAVPVFTADRKFLSQRIPRHWQWVGVDGGSIGDAQE
jgi:tRNA(His) guanylyltransferase